MRDVETTEVVFLSDGTIMGGRERWLLDVLTRIDSTRFKMALALPQAAQLPILEEKVQQNSIVVKRYSSIPELKKIFPSTRIWFAHLHHPGNIRNLGTIADDKKIWYFFHDPLEYNLPYGLKPLYEFIFQQTKIKVLKQISKTARIRFFTGSKWSVHFLRSRYNIEADILPYGVDTNLFKPAPLQKRLSSRRALGIPLRKPVVVYPARFPVEKNQWLVVNLAKLFPEVHFVLAGSGFLRNVLMAASLLKKQKNIKFFKHVDVNLLYSAGDILIFPSLAESFGLIMLEAMASGLPVIASDFGPQREVLTGIGFLAKPTVGEFGKALKHLLTNPKLRVRIGKQGREYVLKRYPLDRLIKRIEKLLVQELRS